MKKEKSCGCIVFDKDKHVLLVKMNKGHWSFPKGHVEEGESEYETAYRETKEETNIDCKIIDGFRHVVTYSPKKGIMKDVIFFFGLTDEHQPTRQVEEIAKTGFFNFDEAEKKITYQTDKELLKEAIKFAKEQQIL